MLPFYGTFGDWEWKRESVIFERETSEVRSLNDSTKVQQKYLQINLTCTSYRIIVKESGKAHLQ